MFFFLFNCACLEKNFLISVNGKQRRCGIVFVRRGKKLRDDGKVGDSLRFQAFVREARASLTFILFPTGDFPVLDFHTHLKPLGRFFSFLDSFHLLQLIHVQVCRSDDWPLTRFPELLPRHHLPN